MKIVTAIMVSLLWVHLASAGSADTTSYMDSAQTSIDQQEWSQAESHLLQVIKHNFNHVHARYLLGKIAEERGELRLAKKRYKMVLFIDRKHLLATKGWARIAEKLASDDILTVYLRLLKLDPDNALWHVKVAQLYMKNRSIKAERYLKSALKISPNYLQALQLMVEYHTDFAIAAHAKPFQKRLDGLTAVLQQDEPVVLSNNRAAPVKKLSAQEELLDKEEPAVDQDQLLIDQYMNAARKCMQDKNWIKAEAYLSKVIKRNFKHITARYLMGKVAEERGEFRLAKKRYKMAIFIDKKYMLALTGWGRVSKKLDSGDELVAYQRAMRLEPKNALWHLKVAQYYMKHQPLKAKRFLNNALRIDPNNRQALQLMIKYQQNYTLIAHAETYQSRLSELLPALTSSPEQLTTAVLSHAKHDEPSVFAVQQQVEQNRSQSDVSLFQQYALAVKQGKANDQFVLALMYHEGRGVAKNDVQALVLLRLAAKQGLDRAQLTLGLMLYEARSNKMKEKAALKWFKKAAKQGSMEAQYAMGLIYATNDSYKNEIKAVKWWRAAALQGHAAAQHNLGVMYFYGFGVAKNRMEAMRWLQQDSEHDHSDISLN